MRTARLLSSCLIPIIVFASTAVAQSADNVVLNGRWSNGPCRAVAGVDGLFAVGNGATLELISVEADGSFATLGKVQLRDDVLDVALSDTLALAACGTAGLQVVRISDPAAPRLIGAWSGDHAVNAVAAGGRYAYVAEDSVDLRVLDLQDPTGPVSVSGAPSSARRTAVALSGDHVYVGDNGGDLTVYDVSDPRHPDLTDWYGDSGDVFDIDVVGGYAYLAQGALGLLIIDVNDPEDINDVGRLPLSAGWALGVAVDDTTAYVSAAGGGLRVIGVADAAAPVERGFLATGGYAGDVALSGGLALMADSWPGVRVIDVSDTAAPVLVGTAATRANASRIVIDDGVMAVVDLDAGLRLLTDVGQGPPVELSSLALPYACDVVLSDGLALVARERDGLTVVDVSDPTAPDSLTTVDTDGLARAVVVHRGRVWLADGEGGLVVFTLGASGEPVEEGRLSVGSDIIALAPWGDRMVLIDASDGLLVIDAATPASPTPLGLLDLPGTPSSVTVIHDHAYVAAGSAGVRVVSLADPADPVEVFDVASSGAVHVCGDDEFLVVASGGRGVRVLDLTDPAAPFEDGWYETDTASAASYGDRRIRLADGFGGVLVLINAANVRLDDDPPPPVHGPATVAASFAAPRPNPANPSCEFRFELGAPAAVVVEIVDLRGRVVRRIDGGRLPIGGHALRWNGRDQRGGDAASGAYMARLRAGDLILSRPLLLVR